MFLLAAALLQIGAAAVPSAAPRPAYAQDVQTADLRDEDFLFFSVALDGVTLTETMTAYEASENPLLPLGELARLLDLDVEVMPPEGQATGRLGEAERPFTIDISAGLARVAGTNIPIPAGAAGASITDIYVRASLLEQILPLRIRVEPEFLQITLTATETLPIQARAQREARLNRLLDRAAGPAEPVLYVDTPYRIATPPAFDVAVETGHDSHTGLTTRRYDLRAAGDLLHAGFTAYLGSDETGDPSTARLRFERRAPEGGLLGPLDASHVAAGDVFTPLMPLGPSSAGGRGISLSAGRLGETSVFQHVTLRGELPLGYDAELYVNDVLRSGQRTPVDGRYEFVDVPLSRGVNVIRIVLYGPDGERTEQTRVINAGGGAVERGALALQFGAVQQDRPLFDLDSETASTASAAIGKLRIAGNVSYGLRDDLTLVAGGASYADAEGRRRTMATAGARGSAGGLALMGDLAADTQSGAAAVLGVAGEVLGASAALRHVEYRGGFVDETNRAVDLTRSMQRRSEANVNFDLRPIAGAGIPMALRGDRAEYSDGGVTWTGSVRGSAVVADTLVSAGLDYRSDARPDLETTRNVNGHLTASRYVAYAWRMRAALDYELAPDSALRSFAVTADRDLSETLAIRLGLGRTFGRDSDFSVQAGAFFRLNAADLVFSGDYTTRGDWRIGVRLAFGLLFNPVTRRPATVRPGAAGGGGALVHAFLDSNGDGRFDAGEDPVAGVALRGGERDVTTGPDGRALVTGLGDSGTGSLRASLETIDLFHVSSPPENIEFMPRPGALMLIPYPLAPAGEVYAQIWLDQGERGRTGLAAVRVRLVAEDGRAIEANTEFDGSAVFPDVTPGVYRLELDPDQARRLRMRLARPATVVVDGDGFAPDVSAEVVFDAPAR